MRKILYSPSYGAGWTSWERDYEVRKLMIDYAPIIEYIENGGTFDRKDLDLWDTTSIQPDPDKVKKLPECLRKFIAECQEKFDRVPGLGGLTDIEVEEVNGAVKIDDYDGYESIERGGGEWL